MNLIITFDILDHFWTRKLLNRCHVFTRQQLCTTLVRLEHMPQIKVKKKVKCILEQDMKDRYSSILMLTSTLDGVDS